MDSNSRLTYTVDEVAEMLGLGKTLTYNMVKTGKIPAIKLGGRWIIPASRLFRLLDGEGGLG